MAKYLFKRTLLVLLAFSLSYSLACGQGASQALFDRANDELEQNKYFEALSRYQQLEQRPVVSGALFLNLGITYQRLDSLGKAKYYFIKASRFNETRDRANQALEVLEPQFSRQSAMLPQLPWDRATNWLQHSIGAAGLLALGIILLNIGILIFVAQWFVNNYTRFFHTGGLIIAGLSVLLIGVSFYTEYVADRYSTAVMVTEKEPVRERPSSEASLVSQAFEGYAFTVDHYESESEEDWSYVRMSNGLYGWIPDSEIMVL